MERLEDRFRRLYGTRAQRCLDRLGMLIGRYGVGTKAPRAETPAALWNERDAVLITYGDILSRGGEHPLLTLARFLNDRLHGAVSTVHILPFFPYSSDDGFSVIDYRRVNPELGRWDDLAAIGEHFDLMFDLVLNHVSRHSEWFHDYVGGIAPARDYFIEVDPGADLSAVVRPRSLPLLSAVNRGEDTRHLWTTFSEDQIDLNFANPDVLFEFLDILMLYVAKGARIIRLDAIAYLWKEIGTPCIHLPGAHEVVKVFRDLLAMVAPEVILLTETNVPHQENVSYFGDGDEAHMVYQFPLPPLLLHALQQGTARHLTAWAAGLGDPGPGRTFLNFTASHDGIGVRPLEGILSGGEFEAVCEGTERRGGRISTRKHSDGSESPYEMNITYFDALADPDGGEDPRHTDRFLCSQTVALGLKGVPAVYFNSLVAARNDHDRVRRTGAARDINRTRWMADPLEQLLDADGSVPAQVFREYVRRLRLRAKHPAFHPAGGQRVLDLGESVFAFERTSPDGGESITCISNFTTEPVSVRLEGNAPRHDLLTGGDLEVAGKAIRLDPYQTAWLSD